MTFVRYLRQLYPPDVRIAIVLDNVSPHLATKQDPRVAQWAAANNVELAYTPTYSSWLNRIEAQFQALRYFALDGTDHHSHAEQASMIRRYIIWRNRHALDDELREIVKRKRCLTRHERVRGTVGRTGRDSMAEAWLEELSHEECIDLLRPRQVGRIAFVSDDAPVVFPINYRLVETAGPTWLALRTRPGNVIDQAPMKVALQIDGIEPFQPAGWSVLVRGTLHRVDRDAAGFEERFNPEPWLVAERDAWLVIEAFSVTGRRLHAPEPEWAFHLAAYL